jgi:hypothetical protein
MKKIHPLHLTTRAAVTLPIFVLLTSLFASSASAAFATTVPLSEESANSIASSLFPRAHTLERGRLYISKPLIWYPQPHSTGLRRVTLRVNLQILEQKPGQPLVATAPGLAEISGELGYDADTMQILLGDPRLDRLDFSVLGSQEAEVTKLIYQEWEREVTNPMRFEPPSHPFLIPFMHGIRNISLEDEGIVIEVVIE